jgi:uroporphyrinogen III methyltransferase/synthase
MERAIKGLVTGRYQWVAFTSTNAVKAVREKLEEYGLDARAFAVVKVAAGSASRPPPRCSTSASGLTRYRTASSRPRDWPTRGRPYDDLPRSDQPGAAPRADIATETLVARLTGPSAGRRRT